MTTTPLLIALAGAAAVLAMTACSSESESGSADDDSNAAAVQNASLQSQLDERRADFNARADEDTKQTYDRGVQQVGESGVMDTALRVGDDAPDFTLPSATGEDVTLSSLLAEGPVVLTWYRGGWCPYCNIQLKAYQERLADFQAAGAQLVAISPELPDNSLSTREKNELDFVVLSDQGLSVAEQFGIAYTLPTEVQDKFKGRLDLPTFNGDDSWRLPLSATYIIATDGTIRYAYLNEDYRERAETADLLAELGKL